MYVGVSTHTRPCLDWRIQRVSACAYTHLGLDGATPLSSYTLPPHTHVHPSSSIRTPRVLQHEGQKGVHDEGLHQVPYGLQAHAAVLGGWVGGMDACACEDMRQQGRTDPHNGHRIM